ncbi:hypothetical protein [Streptomyces sp. NPDC127039]|uniref:hypothetical protein n=1 Tax=Streptomyces sp. NPDC127039 TaxID=3347115 RepID=UPI00365B0F21
MKAPAARSLVLASQPLSLRLRNDRQVVTRIEAARRVGVPVFVPALTVVEAVHGETDAARLHWGLSQLQIQDVTQADSLTAVRLLGDAGGLHGGPGDWPGCRPVAGSDRSPWWPWRYPDRRSAAPRPTWPAG